MSAYDQVAPRLASVLERVGAAAARSGREASAVELMAVTKFHPIEAVLAAWEAGCRLFGESRVQEAEAKYAPFLASHPGARLEMIGQLQSNKARKVPGLFTRVQSVDSSRLLAELNSRHALACGAPDGGRLLARLEVLLELHTGEESKAGFRDLEALIAACEASSSLDRISIRGLMTMAPFSPDQGLVRQSFVMLREAFEAIMNRFAFPGFDVLSMGMSGDFELAVEEGSTLIRLGTALFGERAP